MAETSPPSFSFSPCPSSSYVSRIPAPPSAILKIPTSEILKSLTRANPSGFEFRPVSPATVAQTSVSSALLRGKVEVG